MSQGFLIYKLELVASGSKAVCRMGCGNGKNGHPLSYKEIKNVFGISEVCNIYSYLFLERKREGIHLLKNY